ncbi:ATP-binding protein [Methanobrevibacter sp. DSM 116169]|uniref:ATP-binding protein n=1 Tax=Methanobrevibacter sp. DSM 116169 TaxID=3242727 RepID=UPI0038FD3793
MIKRELYLNKINPYINKDIIKVITGIRRCGKSTILKQLSAEFIDNGVNKENIILINFELKEYFNIENIDQLDNLVNKLIKNKKDKIYLLFDEIQEVNGWEKLINSYLAEGRFDIYITGSNAKLLSRELASYLTGRYVEIKVYPFSYQEFLEYTNSKHDKNLFNEYIKFGGMPFILKFDDNEKNQYLTDLYNSIILKDVVKRNEIRDIDLLDRIIQFLMSNIGQSVSANNISKYLKKDKVKVSVNTIYNYLSYLEEACFINKVKREDLIGKKILNFPEKFYLTDLGFRQSTYGNNHKDIGQSLENLVFIELLRRDHDIKIGICKNKEIDFVCRKGDDRIYIQVSYLLASDEIIKREFDSLNKIQDNYPKYVLSLDDFDFSKNGIKHLNIVDFLTSDEI